MKRAVKDWLIVLVLLLDDAAAMVLVLLVLWLLGVKISLPVAVLLAVLIGGFVFLTHKVIIPSFHKRRVTGSEGMIGLIGKVVEPLTPVGVVRVKGEYWKARAAGEDLAAGAEVEVLGLDGLTLEVGSKDR